MVKRIFVLLILAYLGYTLLVYCYSTKPGRVVSREAKAGFSTWQEKNCQSCHQLYGLGGYMGPDLTNIISDPLKGRAYAYAFIKGGSPRMPRFQFSEAEINQVLEFLTWVDQSGRSRVPAEKVTWTGNYDLESN
jgi:nitric oxide reductase subunit C